MWYQIVGCACLFGLGLLAAPLVRVRTFVLRALLWSLAGVVTAGLVVACLGFLNPSWTPASIQTVLQPVTERLESIESPLLRPGWSWVVIALLWSIIGLVVSEIVRFAWQLGELTRKVVSLSGVNAQVQTIQEALSELDQSIGKVRQALAMDAKPEGESEDSAPQDDSANVRTVNAAQRTLLEVVQQQ